MSIIVKTKIEIEEQPVEVRVQRPSWQQFIYY